VLVVDDEEPIRRQVRERLESETLEGSDEPTHVVVGDFNEAMKILEDQRFDMVVLDVIKGKLGGGNEGQGIATLDEIKKRRFVPVVFYTALPRSVEDLASPFVRVVEKTQRLDALVSALRDLLATELPTISRRLTEHFDRVQREYMWSFVSSKWSDVPVGNRTATVGYMLARRFAASMSLPAVEVLASELGDKEAELLRAGKVPGSRYYLIPPMSMPAALAGDIYSGRLHDRDGFWILLTPSCDLAQDKAEFALLAPCMSLRNTKEWKRWEESAKKEGAGDLKQLIRNARSERYFFLPESPLFPHLVVDYQPTESVRCEELDALERLASLDSPFAEAMLARFGRYASRLGTPDLDIDTDALLK
jgi:CheY-like chemotaxis protein